MTRLPKAKPPKQVRAWACGECGYICFNGDKTYAANHCRCTEKGCLNVIDKTPGTFCRSCMLKLDIKDASNQASQGRKDLIKARKAMKTFLLSKD